MDTSDVDVSEFPASFFEALHKVERSRGKGCLEKVNRVPGGVPRLPSQPLGESIDARCRRFRVAMSPPGSLANDGFRRRSRCAPAIPPRTTRSSPTRGCQNAAAGSRVRRGDCCRRDPGAR